MTDYIEALQNAAAAWMNISGLTDAWARKALCELITGQATELEISTSVYHVIKPVNPKGELLAPRIKDGRVSVRSLENATVPVAGAAAARKNLEAVLFVYENREKISDELTSFISGDQNYRLYGLCALLKGQC